MKVNYKQIAAASWIFCLLPTLSFAEPVCSAAEPDYPPLSIVNPNGQANGFSVELLRATLAEMGREVVFETGPWAELKNKLANGSLDVLPLVGRTPEREALYDFTIPYLTLHGALFIRDDNRQIQGLSDLPGRRIAVMKGDNAEEYVQRTHLSDNVISTTTFEEAFLMLSDGRADAVIAQKLMGVSLLKKLGLKNIQVRGKPNEEFRQDFCFAVKKGNAELLSVLNEGLALVKTKGVQRQLLHKWMGDSEQDAARARVILYGGDRAYPPYEFLDTKGRPTGFNIELARAVAREAGFDISFQLEHWDVVRRKIKNGEIDMTSMVYSPERANTVDFSAPHSVFFQTVFARTDSPAYKSFADLKGHRVSVQNGDFMHDYALKQGLNEELRVTGKLEDTLAMLVEGQVDFSLGSRKQGLFWINAHNWKNLKGIDSHLPSVEYCFAVTEGNTTLLNLINDSLDQLKGTGEYRQIYNKWLGVLNPEFSWKIKIRYLLITLTVIALLAAFVATIILGLKRQIKKRTAQLQKSNLTLKESQLAALNMMEDAVADKEQMEHLQTGLNTSQQINEGIIHAIPVRVFWKDKNLIYLGCNVAFACDAGFSDPQDVIGKDDTQMAWKDQADLYCADDRRVIESGKAVLNKEEHQTTPEGKSITLLTSKMPLLNAEGEIIGVLGTYVDITAQVQMEAQLQRTQKMEAIGLLAGGIAHDFNNILQGILLFSELLLRKLQAETKEYGHALEIKKAVNQAANLTRQLLTFSRDQPANPEPLDVNTVIENTQEILHTLLSHKIRLVLNPAPHLKPIYADSGQLSHILMNLAINARDAMPEGGQLTLSSENIRLSSSDAAAVPEATPGEFICLSVADTGCGMTQDVKAHLFVPFFTTKEVGKGTGLGLSVVYGLVKKHGGWIQVDSAEGQGTVFKLYFPVHSEAPASIESSGDPTVPSEHILLVDDDPAVRKLFIHLLESAGYRVSVAESAEEALVLFDSNPEAFSLLLSDIVLPGRNGIELADELRGKRPALPVLLCSGYQEQHERRNNPSIKKYCILKKPFTVTTLLMAIDETMSARSGEKGD